MKKSIAPLTTLNNGITMPQLGLGVWQTQDGDEVEHAVTKALEAGYRLVDTAAVYGNEVGVGNALKASGIAREELFITTKLWNSDQGATKTKVAFEASLEKLQLDYIDLYLIHWPMPAKGLYLETWRVLEQLYTEGKIRAIGVCNFQPDQLDNLLQHAAIKPAVNQIELHPRFPQIELRNYAHEHGIQIESWSPIGGSKSNLLDDEMLIGIGKKYSKSPAQVVIRWHIQNGMVVIPKSVHAERIQQNIDVFDFELSGDDMAKINALETGQRVGPDPASVNGNWRPGLVRLVMKLGVGNW